MKTVKEKLYSFEQKPPEEIWNLINDKLNKAGKSSVRSGWGRTRILAFSSAAAAVVSLIIISFIFTNPSTNHSEAPSQAPQAVSFKQSDSIEKNHDALESIIKAPENKKLIASKHATDGNRLKYFTISGPGGEPVKISPKAATLIISADNEYPPKPVWNEKINKWQHIMLTNNTTPTSANLLDIIQKASGSIE